ncbi:PRA1 family protein E [Ananas comosus]|uniref:PRA1 family protein n=1 Tax=Ananas comosus TaxID=4615 RepID=A0A199VVZ0_ANACO|nr:PRA1 family protein E [Ananas comosus]
MRTPNPSSSSSGYGSVPAASPPPPPPTAAASSPPPATSASVGDLVSRFKSQGHALISAQRPWTELFSGPAAFSPPKSSADVARRLSRNLVYFRGNYAIAFLLVLFVSFLSHPAAMIGFVGLCAAWFFLYFSRDGPLVLFGRTLDDSVVFGALFAATVVALLFTDVVWSVVGSLLVGAAIVGLHAALRNTDDLFIDEDEVARGGLISAV